MPGFECGGNEARQETIQIAQTVRKGLIASTSPCAGGGLFIYWKWRSSWTVAFIVADKACKILVWGFNLREVLFLAVAGALGTLSRYALSGIAQRITEIGFPFGTLSVNILGSVLIGFIMQVGLNTGIIPHSARMILTVGFLGAFTTFSTFAYETVRYLEVGERLSGAINIAANVGLSVLAILLGMLLGRVIYGGA